MSTTPYSCSACESTHAALQREDGKNPISFKLFLKQQDSREVWKYLHNLNLCDDCAASFEVWKEHRKRFKKEAPDLQKGGGVGEGYKAPSYKYKHKLSIAQQMAQHEGLPWVSDIPTWKFLKEEKA